MHTRRRSFVDSNASSFHFVCALLFPLLSACIGSAPSAELLDATRDLRGGLPVIPGAEGFGTTTPAGRGGAILVVSSLDAAGPGTLREALLTQGPRTVVFEVGGVITTSESLVIADPYITVAGQTAPAPGITVTGAGLVILTHDVLLQHLRVRAGDSPDGPDPGGRDSLSITGAPDNSLAVHDVVIDHCSFSWAIDEGASTWNPGVSDVTIRRSIIAENLSHSLHEKGEHSKGLLVGDHAKRVTVLQNLFAHNRMRNPFLKGDVSALVANNLIYNPGSEAMHLDDPEGSGPTLATVVENVLVPGLDTEGGVPLVDALAYVKTSSEVQLLDNDAANHDLKNTSLASGIWTMLADLASAKVRVLPLTLLGAARVRATVLAGAGARPRQRDAIDARIVADVDAGTGRIIDSPSQVGGLGVVMPTRRALELPADPQGDADGDGYTNLEAWLQGLAATVEASH